MVIFAVASLAQSVSKALILSSSLNEKLVNPWLYVIAVISDTILLIGFSICVMLIFLSIRKLKDLLGDEELAGGVGINKCVAFTHLTIVSVFYFSQVMYQGFNYFVDYSVSIE